MSDTFLMVGFILGQLIIIVQITEIDGVRSPSPAITMRQLRSFVLLSQFIVLVFFIKWQLYLVREYNYKLQVKCFAGV